MIHRLEGFDMDFKDKLTNITPRESSGARTSNRFDYQKDWAICKLLELHDSVDDYLVIFEYHDDIAIVDSPIIPKKISFYQVKTKGRGNWTIKNLIKKDKNGNTILGKMFLNIINFQDHIESINFISNARYNVSLRNDEDSTTKREILFNELDKNIINDIRLAIKEEHKLENNPIFEDIIYLRCAELNIDNHSDITQAKLMQFIESNFPGKSYIVGPIYRTLFDEVKKKTNFELDCVDFEDFIDKKAISRQIFDEYIRSALSNLGEEFKDIANSIKERLNTENAPLQFILDFSKCCKTLEVNRINPTSVFRNVHARLEAIIDKMDLKISLMENIEEAYMEYMKNKIEQNIIDEYLIKTMILFELYENK
jgi:hypothetical protein